MVTLIIGCNFMSEDELVRGTQIFMLNFNFASIVTWEHMAPLLFCPCSEKD